MHLEELERTLDTISQLLSTRTNIYNIVIQEVIGFGKLKTVLEGKYIRDIKENKDFNKYKSYRTVEILFLSGNCYIHIVDSLNQFKYV